MNWTEAVVQKFERLRERLAAVEAERHAICKLFDEKEKYCIVRRQSLQELNAQLVKNHDAMQAEQDAARERVKHCETRMMRYAMELAEMQAQRDAAQAGEARAVAALKAAYDAAEEWHGSVEWEGREHTQLVIDACHAVLADAQPALGWLAQQRREAAAEALDRLVGEWWASNDEYIASELSARAAALRAGGRRV